MMRRAARLALRGVGRVEPNPPVGCVIVDPHDRTVIAEGWHAQFGGPHAEAHALARRQRPAHGGVAYVTLEPCDHAGKTAPCSRALIDAGIERVVIARRDPHEEAAGGAKRLRESGVRVDEIECEEANRLTDPFVNCVTTGLPWVIVKWAQTIDGQPVDLKREKPGGGASAARAGGCDSHWRRDDRSRRSDAHAARPPAHQ